MHNIYGHDCHLIFEKIFSMATEKGNKTDGVDILAKSSENYRLVKLGCLNFMDSLSILIASLDILATTLASFSSLNSNGSHLEQLKQKLPFPFEKKSNH